jgi:NAD(P)-dependent dehydrogenase (short-subunit alcohol dehydrogenase family)
VNSGIRPVHFTLRSAFQEF